MKNWTMAEAIKVVREGKDIEAIKEIAKHYPIFFMHVATGNLIGLADMMPEKFTLRRLVESDSGNEADEAEETEVEEAEEKAEDIGSVDLTGLSAKQLMAMCDKQGIKVAHYGKSKQFYIDKLTEVANVNGGDDDDEDDEDAAGKYDGKKATELYGMCKKRGIKVETKRPAKYYIDKLEAADAEPEEEDWDDEPDEKPAKKGNKGKKAEVEDDDDDWEI